LLTFTGAQEPKTPVMEASVEFPRAPRKLHPMVFNFGQAVQPPTSSPLEKKGTARAEIAEAKPDGIGIMERKCEIIGASELSWANISSRGDYWYQKP
jgi:hypothetical protein